ncbi:MAG: hypothetical protein HY763_14135 [Planctomycetes bacterium]|nr:hypothetical protein [Planctomycetota bacterium]
MNTMSVDREVVRRVARIKAGILAVVLGLICGGGLFLMTVWLLVKGGPMVGEHLKLLRHYFIGYSVTWGGAFVGLFWGLLVGGLAGWAVGITYNRIVVMRRQ